MFGQNNNYHHIVNGCLEFHITVRKSDSTNFHYDDPVRLLKNGHAFAFCFKEARVSTILGSDIETNKFCGELSTIMKVKSNKDGDLLSQSDKNHENDIPVVERLADLPTRIDPHHIKNC